jgi:hypothetical protein
METVAAINKTLNKIGIGKIRPSQNIVDEALSFNVKDLDTLDSRELTKFIVGLSQYLVYIVLEINKLRIQKIILGREIEVDIVVFVAKSNITKGTKAEKRALALGSSPELTKKDERLQEIMVEFTLLDGIDKYLEFYSNSFKKELKRREAEASIKLN